jgi:glycosyltransferase involved in cell wall biosynthesis
MEKISGHNGKLRICFVAHTAYGAMGGGKSGHIGGVDRQTSLMARWFAANGHPVSMLTWDEGQDDGVEIDGVRVFKMCRKEAGIKGLRFLWPKWTSLIAAMKRADADVYYHNLADCATGQISLWCRRHGRRFVFSVSSDVQCKAELPYQFQERILYRYGLRVADQVIVQTRRQWEMMQENFGRDSVVLPMPCPGPDEDDYRDSELKRNNSKRVLWIGRICAIKRLDRLMDVAEACPELNFDLVGPEDGTDYSRDVCTRAKSIANITLHGPASRRNVPEFYKKAAVMCCTSDFEGFPNTFLEAWSYGLPIVTTFDPDNLIAENSFGIVAQDELGLIDGLLTLCGSPEKRQKISQKVRQFYLKNYTVDSVMPKYEEIFIDVSKRSISSSSEVL